MRPTYSFPEAVVEAIAHDRYRHPDPRVQQRMEVLGLKSKNQTHGDIAELARVAPKPQAPLDAWRARFPDVFAAGGFDVVLGNPPYVRQEWIKDDKPFLQQHYEAFDGVADLYVYFYELGLNLLKPGGRLGFIVTNKWMKAGYGEPLRKLYGESARVESVVDLGHNKEVFPDADVFPCIVVVRKPDAGTPPETTRVCVLPRELTRVDGLSTNRRRRRRGAAVAVRHGPVEPRTARRGKVDG
jgi:hypothetical protein